MSGLVPCALAVGATVTRSASTSGAKRLIGGTEQLYQASLRYDGHARRWLFAGETALVGAAAIFVYEITRHAHKPDNIPFEPEVRSLRQATGVGVRIGF